MTAPASQFVDTCGYRTHYIESGSGRPLILVHGGGAGADARGNWERFSMPLFSASFRTIAYDMVGFGYTDAPSPDDFVYNPESRVAQLIAFIEALGRRLANGPRVRQEIGEDVDRREKIATDCRSA